MDDLNQLAEKAREQLREQNGSNIYKDMIDESSDETPVYPAGEEVNIKNKPDIFEERQSIRNQPTAEDIPEYPEIDEYDRPIFPNGPFQSEINSWKKQYQGYDIYCVEVCNQFFVFRTLNRFEYKQIVTLQNTDPLMREEIICETCSLWPVDYKWDVMATDKAGTPSTYSQIIMEKSGFTKDYSIHLL